MSFLTLDLGTTVCKAALFNKEGELLRLVREEVPIMSPHPNWAEQDTRVLWEKIKKIITRIGKENPSKEPLELW